MPIYSTSVTLSYGQGGPGANTFHVDTADLLPSLGTPLDEAGETLRVAYTAARALFPAGVTISHDATWIRIDTREEIVAGTAWSVTGNSTSPNFLPKQTCLVVGLRTGLRTRSGRGRTFLGPLAVTASEQDGTPSATALQLARTFGLALVAGPEQDGYTFSVYSPTDNEARAVTGVAVRDLFGTLRSRRD